MSGNDVCEKALELTVKELKQSGRWKQFKDWASPEALRNMQLAEERMRLRNKTKRASL